MDPESVTFSLLKRDQEFSSHPITIGNGLTFFSANPLMAGLPEQHVLTLRVDVSAESGPQLVDVGVGTWDSSAVQQPVMAWVARNLPVLEGRAVFAARVGYLASLGGDQPHPDDPQLLGEMLSAITLMRHPRHEGESQPQYVRRLWVVYQESNRNQRSLARDLGMSLHTIRAYCAPRSPR